MARDVLQGIRGGEETSDQMPGIDGAVVDTLLLLRNGRCGHGCRWCEVLPEEPRNPRIVREVMDAGLHPPAFSLAAKEFLETLDWVEQSE